jgi:hypothetical protein
MFSHHNTSASIGETIMVFGIQTTALLKASKDGDLEAAKRAIEMGADVNAKDSDGSRPLHDASRGGHEAVVSLLLTNDANINAKTNGGRTPLHLASSKGQDAVVSLLLENGANVNAKSNRGETPLHEACREGRENIVSLLLEKGGDPTITDNIAETPSQLAQKENKQNCVVAIEQFLQQQLFQKKCLEKFKTRAALERELQRLQHLIDAAKDSVDSEVNSEAVAANAECEMIRPLLKWRQYMTVPELETEIAKLEEQARGMDIGEERMEVLLKRNKLKQYLDGEVLDRAKTPLELAQEQLSEDITRMLTCPISGDFMKDPVILFPCGKTFDRESLYTWLLRGTVPPRCPWTNVPLEQCVTYVENRSTHDFLIH